MRIMYILWYVYQYVNRGIAKPTFASIEDVY